MKSELGMIRSIRAREILSSGGTPSLEVRCELDSGVVGIASVPYGASAGIHEAHVLLDGGERFGGKGMLQAVKNINDTIAPELIGKDAQKQRKIDHIMIDLDGTENKSNLGANAILGVSLAVSKASANHQNIPLYEHLRSLFSADLSSWRIPNPMMVLIEGGKHADQSTDLQEYMVSPIMDTSARENVRCGIEIFLALKKILKANGLNANVGNEGAFAPAGISSNEAPWDLLIQAIEKAGYKPGVDVGLSHDAAISEIYQDGVYDFSLEGKKLSHEDAIVYFKKWREKYPIISLEDCLQEDAWEAWSHLMKAVGEDTVVIGDDLTVTSPERLQRAIDQKAINSILIKLNQIGSVTETLDCCALAQKHDMTTVVSHRGGGETNDTAMVDLAVAVGASFIKVGPSRGERVCKYNRLMEIEEELGPKAIACGSSYQKTAS